MTLFWYVLSTYLVCTGLYYFAFSVPVRTGMYRYVLVRTKNPIPVQRFTIPDVGAMTKAGTRPVAAFINHNPAFLVGTLSRVPSPLAGPD